MNILNWYPTICAGDTVRVNLIREANRERIKYSKVSWSKDKVENFWNFYSKKVSYGSVLKNFPSSCPTIASIEVVRRGKLEELNYTIFVNCLRKRLELKKKDKLINAYNKMAAYQPFFLLLKNISICNNMKNFQ